MAASSPERRRGHDQLEQKSVQLRFRQGVRPLHLDGVLGRQHKKRLVELIRMCPATVTPCSCMASNIADCVLGVARLISSASTMLANTGPGWNWKTLRPVASSIKILVPGDVGGHQIRRELDAREATNPAPARASAPAEFCPGRERLPAGRVRPDSRQISTPSTMSKFPTMTLPTSARTRLKLSLNCATVCSLISIGIDGIRFLVCKI